MAMHSDRLIEGVLFLDGVPVNVAKIFLSEEPKSDSVSPKSTTADDSFRANL